MIYRLSTFYPPRVGNKHRREYRFNAYDTIENISKEFRPGRKGDTCFPFLLFTALHGLFIPRGETTVVRQLNYRRLTDTDVCAHCEITNSVGKNRNVEINFFEWRPGLQFHLSEFMQTTYWSLWRWRY